MTANKPQQLTLETLEEQGQTDAPAPPSEPNAAGATMPPEEADSAAGATAPPEEASGAGDAGDDEPAPEPGPLVTELTNGSDGCWKVLAGGERVSISDEEWRQELTRLIARRRPASAG